MVEALQARSPLASVLQPRRHGPSGPAGVSVAERVIGGAASLAARAGGTEALEAALRWTLPTQPRRVRNEGSDVVWTGPERWLVLSDAHIATELGERAGAAGSVADQGDSRVVLQLTGERVRDVLAKGLSVDLHPRAFAIDAAAATVAAHIPALLWRDGQDVFVVAVPRSYSGSFAEWLLTSAGEFGLEVG